MQFEELGLGAEVLRAVAEAGYKEPTPIQQKAIPTVLMGRDVLGVAQTGTGKTAGFTLPMIDILASGRAKMRMPRSLILEPTRELAAQVADSFEKYGKYHRLSMALLIGGESFKDQEAALDKGVDVLIATPGRLLDLFQRGKILLADSKLLVIDEADRMLDMGFIPDVERIVSLLPRMRQTLFFSATMAPEIRRLADKFLLNPKEISVAPPATAAATVSQYFQRCGHEPKMKRAALRRLLSADDVKSAIVFSNRKRDVGVVHRSLVRHGFDAEALHGDMPQPSRMATLDKFKKGDVRILVCSDVAARGLDIPAVSHVFNYDVPHNAEDYVHRIGRTGRAGRSGTSVTLVTGDDRKTWPAVVRLIGRDVEELPGDTEAAPVPTRETREQPARGGKRRSTRSRSEEAEAKPDRKDKSGGERKSRAPAREQEGQAVTAFGDDVPAFMLTPVPNV